MVGKNKKQITEVKLEMELETLERIESLFGTLETGKTLQLCDGEINLKLLSSGSSLSFDGGVNIDLVMSFSVGVASGLVANSIYSAICAGIKKLQINGRRVRPTEDSIYKELESIKKMVEFLNESQISKKTMQKTNRYKKECKK